MQNLTFQKILLLNRIQQHMNNLVPSIGELDHPPSSKKGGKRKVEDDSSSSTKPKAPPKTKNHGVITEALSTLVHAPDHHVSGRKIIPSCQNNPYRHIPVQVTTRHACRMVSEAADLATQLMTIFLIYLVDKGFPIPSGVCNTQNPSLWSWCYLLVTTESGLHKLHEFSSEDDRAPEEYKERKIRTANAKSDTTEDDEVKPAKKSKKQRKHDPVEEARIKQQIEATNLHQDAITGDVKTKVNLFRALEHVFNTVMVPLYGRDFVWPDRQHLGHIIREQTTHHATAFKNMYSTNLLSRQSKVLRQQITRLPEFVALTGLNTKKRRALRNLCTRWCQSTTNRWLPSASSFDTVWNRYAHHVDSAPLRQALVGIVQQHQDGFGPVSSPLRSNFYRLSEGDASRHANLYIHYFHYMSMQYDEFRKIPFDDPQKIKSSQATKFDRFSICPQVSRRLKFIHINASGLLDIIHLSKLNIVRDEVDRRLIEATSNHNHNLPLSIEWVPKKITYAYIGKAVNGSILFEAVFSGYAGQLCRVGDPRLSTYLSRRFTNYISTDGQQVKIHYETLKIGTVDATDDASDDVTAINLNPDDDVNSMAPSVSKEQMVDYLKLLEQGKLQFIANDPGIENIMSAVRFEGIPDALINHSNQPQHRDEAAFGTSNDRVSTSDIPTASTWRTKPWAKLSKYQKKKRARHERLQESKQSTYMLTNKSYHNQMGHTHREEKLRRWRHARGIPQAFDIPLSQLFETHNNKTFVMETYLNYVSLVARTFRLLWDTACQPAHQKLRFETYKKEQRAIYQIAQELCQGRPNETILLWGAANFSATTKGHAAAPNKGLRKRLSPHIPHILLTSEWGSTKNTACCHTPSAKYDQEQMPKRYEDYPGHPIPIREPRGLLYCKSLHCRRSHSHFLNHTHAHGSDFSINTVAERVVCDGDDDEKKKDDNVRMLPYGRRPPIGGNYSRPWNRDISAAINIFYICYCHAMGCLSDCFNPSARRQEVVEITLVTGRRQSVLPGC